MALVTFIRVFLGTYEDNRFVIENTGNYSKYIYCCMTHFELCFTTHTIQVKWRTTSTSHRPNASVHLCSLIHTNADTCCGYRKIKP